MVLETYLFIFFTRYDSKRFFFLIRILACYTEASTSRCFLFYIVQFLRFYNSLIPIVKFLISLSDQYHWIVFDLMSLSVFYCIIFLEVGLFYFSLWENISADNNLKKKITFVTFKNVHLFLTSNLWKHFL